VERSEFRSVRKHAWDAVPNEYLASGRLPLSIPSVRELLASVYADPPSSAAGEPADPRDA
jgi:hypothetical protein